MVIAPLARAERISLIDSLRGFALLGILLMNMPFFSGPYLLSDNPLILQETGLNYWCWWVVRVFFDGTMRGMFSMLFGAGTFLLISRLEQKNSGLLPADIYYRRLWWLMLFGLIDGYIILWPGDILLTYGITGLLFFPFRNLKTRGLLLFSAVFMVICSIQSTLHIQDAAKVRKEGMEVAARKAKHKSITPKQKASLETWTKLQNEQNLDTLRKKSDSLGVQYRRNDYVAQQKEISGVKVYLETKELFTTWIWESLAFFLFGLALFKAGILTGKKSPLFYVVMGALGYAVGATLRIQSTNFTYATAFDASRLIELEPVSLYQVSRIGMTLGHLSVLVLLYKTGVFSWVFKALANVGQMAFTNYLSQSLICTFLFFGYGFGLFGLLQRYQTYGVVVAIWVFQLIFSAIWMRYFLFGPLEWVWRSLTYWERQPILRAKR